MIPLRRGGSLRFRLVVGGALLLMLLGLVTAAGAYLAFERFAGRLTEASLVANAERVLGAIRPGLDGPWLDQDRLDPVYRRPLSGDYFRVTFDGREWRSRSLWDTELLTLPPAADAVGLYILAGPGAQRLRILEQDFTRHGQVFRITVATDYRPMLDEFERAIKYFTLLWGLALLLGWLVLVVSLRKGLEPLERVRNQARSMAAGDLRPLSEDVPDELQPLIRQINELLGRSREALQRSRQALGNLGHALKTPLAVLSNLVERDIIRCDPELHRALRNQIDVLSGRVERELGREYVQPGSILEPSDLKRELPVLLEALRRAHNRDLVVDQEMAASVVLPFDRADMLEVLGNLLDNAWKWAERRIAVRCALSGTHWRLVVEDDGPGIADPEDRQRVLERGTRLDESMAGQGLGLAIAADVVAAYDGQLTLGRSALGGLAVEVQLPVPGGTQGI